MPDFIVVLVEPKYEGNVGFIARAMHNFGLHKLALVNPCEMDAECRKRAKHALHILEDATYYDDFESACKDLDLVVGTTGIVNVNEKHRMRNPIPPQELGERIWEIDGKAGLCFAREDYGLYKEEILACDILVNIPVPGELKILNISHAAILIFWELFRDRYSLRRPLKASGVEKERLHKQFAEYLKVINYPPHQREQTEVIFRRLTGKAMLSKWDFHTLMGVFGMAGERLEQMREEMEASQDEGGKVARKVEIKATKGDTEK